jgi:RNA recognition motif-containing protein
MAATDREHAGRTVFVRNVSYDVDDKALEEAFNEVGPVRQAFLVKEKGSQRHKGYGYVQFALEMDADRAVQELHGHALQGRALKVRAGRAAAAPAGRRPPPAATPQLRPRPRCPPACTTGLHARTPSGSSVPLRAAARGQARARGDPQSTTGDPCQLNAPPSLG